jgi:hypothetical protein
MKLMVKTPSVSALSSEPPRHVRIREHTCDGVVSPDGISVVGEPVRAHRPRGG